jgi:hypothetical protein
MAPTGSKGRAFVVDFSLQEGNKIKTETIIEKKCVQILLLKSIIKK